MSIDKWSELREYLINKTVYGKKSEQPLYDEILRQMGVIDFKEHHKEE